MPYGHPKFLLIKWEDMTYKVMHYSHNWEDMQAQMLKHQDCTLMLNYEEVRTKDQRDKVKLTMEQIIEAIRRKQSK